MAKPRGRDLGLDFPGVTGPWNAITDVASQDFVQAYLADAANGNSIVDPELRGISRSADGGLDPRPSIGSPAWGNTLETGVDFFTSVPYVGAFGTDNWLIGWTALDGLGFLDSESQVGIETLSEEVPAHFTVAQNYPNPFNPTTTIEFQLKRAQHVQLNVFDILGRQVALLLDEVTPAGSYRLQFDAGELAAGAYIYQIKTAAATVNKTMMLLE